MTDPCLNANKLIHNKELATLCQLKQAAAKESMTFKAVLDEALKKAATSRYVVEAMAVPTSKANCPPCTLTDTKIVKQATKRTETKMEEAKQAATKAATAAKQAVTHAATAAKQATTHAASAAKQQLKDTTKMLAQQSHKAINTAATAAHNATAAATQQVKKISDKITKDDIASIAAPTDFSMSSAKPFETAPAPKPLGPAPAAKPLGPAPAAKPFVHAPAATVKNTNILDDIVNTITGKSGGARSRRRKRQRNKRTRRKNRRNKRKRTRYRRKRRRHRRTKKY